MTFSLCAIFKNEAAILETFIQRHIGLVDEMVLVDTGSTDRSAQIIGAHGLPVHQFEWIDDFSAARNYALSKATQEMVVVLDIDEWLTAEGMAQLCHRIDRENADGYSLKQINFYNDYAGYKWKPIRMLSEEICETPGDSILSKATGYIPSPLIRVFKNRMGIRFSGRIHEIVGDSFTELKLRSVKTDIPIYHYGWITGDRSDRENEEKKNWYNTIIKKAWETEKTAKAGYYYLSVIQSPDERLKQLFRMMKQFPEIKEFHEMRAQTAWDLEQIDRAHSYCEKSLVIFPENEHILSVYARCLIIRNQAEKAVEILRRLVGQNPYGLINQQELLKALVLLNRKGEALALLDGLPADIPEAYRQIFKTYLSR